MSTVFFDTKPVRRCETLRKDKNHNSVLTLKPMTFLVKRNPTALPDAHNGKRKFNSDERFATQSLQPTVYAASKYLSWWMMKA
jgi:hypothetical protein